MDIPTHEQTAWTVLAHLLRPQGRKGELLAELFTDFPESLTGRPGLFLRASHRPDEPASVESSWLPVGRNAGRVVLKFEGIDSIETAERLSGCDLVIPSEQRLPLNDEDDQYIADLLDCTVFDREQIVGTIEDVQFPLNASGTRLEDATPLLVLKGFSGQEFLIPFAKEWIMALEIQAKRIVLRLPEGLLEINSRD